MSLVSLDYFNIHLTGLPVCTNNPLQMIQNAAAAHLIFDQSKTTSTNVDSDTADYWYICTAFQWLIRLKVFNTRL